MKDLGKIKTMADFCEYLATRQPYSIEEIKRFVDSFRIAKQADPTLSECFAILDFARSSALSPPDAAIIFYNSKKVNNEYEVYTAVIQYDNKYFPFIKHKKEVHIIDMGCWGEAEARSLCAKEYGHLKRFRIKSIKKIGS